MLRVLVRSLYAAQTGDVNSRQDVLALQAELLAAL